MSDERSIIPRYVNLDDLPRLLLSRKASDTFWSMASAMGMAGDDEHEFARYLASICLVLDELNVDPEATRGAR